MMQKPNFFIIGDIKAATTSLHFYLRNHPEIFLPQVKELRFFSNKYSLVSQDSDGHLINKATKDYLLNFCDVKNEKAIGEASPQYLRSFHAPANIHKFNPNAKIIIILRNPADRLFSLYQMHLRDKPKLNFHSLIYKKNHEWIKGNFLYNDLYNYYQLFPRNNIKVVIFDDLKDKPNLIMREIYRFLDVSENYEQDFFVYNKGGQPKFLYLNKFVHKIRKYFRNNPNTPKSFKYLYSIYKKYFVKLNSSIDSNDKKFITDVCRNDILMTQKLIEKDISFWL